MAEAIAAIGLVASIVQLIDFGSKVVSRLHGLNAELADGPRVLHDLRTRLPLMLDLVKEIKSRMDAGEVSNASQEVMWPVIQSCLIQLRTLDDLLSKSVPRSDDSTWLRRRKAVFGAFREPEMQKIDSVLKTNFDLLVQAGTFQSVSRLERWGSSSQSTVNVIMPSQPTSHTASQLQLERLDSTSLQPVFMVPFQRDPKFLGRPATMDELSLKFRNQRQVALAGLGGVG